MKRSLLLGCGNCRIKKVYLNDEQDWVGELTTLDMNPNCGADVIFDLDRLKVGGCQNEIVNMRLLPFGDETFDEMGAYDVLEHQGSQGDWRGWFAEMTEYWRILKPGGTFGIVVPVGADALADPGHTRFFHQNHFGFLSEAFYQKNVDSGTQFTDYRWYLKKYWEVLYLDQSDHHLSVMLRKPYE